MQKLGRIPSGEGTLYAKTWQESNLNVYEKQK